MCVELKGTKCSTVLGVACAHHGSCQHAVLWSSLHTDHEKSLCRELQKHLAGQLLWLGTSYAVHEGMQ